MKPVITITFNPAIDKSTSVTTLVPDRKLRCSPPVFEPGGGGVNVARAIVKLGGQATAAFFGGGYTGHFFNELLAAEQVTAIMIPIAQHTRENLIVTDEATQQQFRFNMPGPYISEKEWLQGLEILDNAMNDVSFVVASGGLTPGLAENAFQHIGLLAKRKGIPFIVDTSGKALQLAANSGVYLLKPNLAELATLAGKEELTGEETVVAARSIIQAGDCRYVVVSLGAGGAILVTEEEVKHYQAPVVKALSTVGAGDSMVAGMVLQLARGADIYTAVKFGVASGTAATMNSGTALCHLKDAEELFQSMG
ncbi:1-phosphofructokinase family hexose kinase [Chitinophaga silvatica]|uniref:1-phosphofructokinase family hexose kinase n=1 Tax=Chitinophaga silvatica TaxID=2282649 RepID=A0A3E1Y7D2_9BACT|nr:1-phosphofructokinase family hexose kinase [Chitinophaga silvatica]RFS20653.1 1-phosphofructokinase family hexose kinase [Chitinophaga silvatica]